MGVPVRGFRQGNNVPYLLSASREAEARLQNVAMDRAAASMTPFIGRALATQMKAGADALSRGEDWRGAVLNADQQLKAAYATTYKRASDIVARRVLNAAKSLHGQGYEIKADGVPVLESWNRTTAEWIRQWSAFRVTQVNETTIAQLQIIIAGGYEDGAGVLGIQRAIMDSIPTLTPIRARAIARTETHAGAQAGSLNAAKAIEIDLSKQWNAVEDGRARDDHAAADGQTVEIDQQFIVGGDRLAHPGDPAGQADQVINCRCVLDYPVE